MNKKYYWAIVIAATVLLGTMLTASLADAKPDEKPEPQGPLNDMNMFNIGFGETLQCSPTNDILVHVLTTLFGSNAGLEFSNGDFAFAFGNDKSTDPGIVSFTQGVEGGKLLQVSSQEGNIVYITIQKSPQTNLGCEIAPAP